MTEKFEADLAQSNNHNLSRHERLKLLDTGFVGAQGSTEILHKASDNLINGSPKIQNCSGGIKKLQLKAAPKYFCDFFFINTSPFMGITGDKHSALPDLLPWHE